MALVEIKKSKFISLCFNVESAEDVSNILETIKKENKKATHVCFAYRIVGAEFLEKAFDDGEPSGTAGKPILNVIQKQNLSNVLIVVVRYFGGIKLGAGGLLRAYLKAASEATKEFLEKQN